MEIEDSDNFVAKIELLRTRGAEQKIVRFNRHKVTMTNLEQFEEGAVFYWTVGVFQNEQKMMVKRSEIRFQMLNAPSPIFFRPSLRVTVTSLLYKKHVEPISSVDAGISMLVAASL